jgi:hypothetical protein
MKKTIKESKMFIETEYRKGGEAVSNDFEEKPIKTVVLSTEDSVVIESKLGMTISLGNYEFLRVDAGISMPCEKSRLYEAYDEAFALAGEQLFKRVEEAKKSLI